MCAKDGSTRMSRCCSGIQAVRWACSRRFRRRRQAQAQGHHLVQPGVKTGVEPRLRDRRRTRMMLSRAALLSALLFGVAFTAPQRDDRGRPVILMVHGRGMVGRDTGALRVLWRDGLNAGAKALSKQPLITDRDVRLVWYADVLEPSSAERCSYSSSDPRARRDATGDPELK